MSITTLSSREFNQDVTRAKKAAYHGPVFITERGTPSHVLLKLEDYRELTHQRLSIVDILAMDEDVEFEVPQWNVNIRPAVFE